MTVESKFTEAGFGGCSQARWRRPRRGEEDRETDETDRVLDCSGIYGPGRVVGLRSEPKRQQRA